ncbi:tRNAHis-5'-guanylyltransferase [Minicystis rosea]|nr:tRNAHis-5'-guanylyltransferase [Minicystis rosea]
MRRGEYFHALRVLEGMYIVVRVDGRSFSRLTERTCEKPFDPKFHQRMTDTAKALLSSLQGTYAYTESDEISVLLPRDSDLFDREVEKLVSIAAGAASAHMSLAMGEPVEFDARLWVGARRADVVDYFRWRQADATRCALNGHCYWMLRNEGKSVGEATRALLGMSVSKKNELLFSRGINFNDVPSWQRRGSGIYWDMVTKTGKNPKTGAEVVVNRRRLRVDGDLPMKETYGKFVTRFLKEHGEEEPASR